MSWLFRYTGAVLMMICATVIAFGYKRYVARAERERDGFSELIDYMRIRIDCYLSTVGEMFSDFRCDAIEPFLTRVRNGERVEAAFGLSRRVFAIGKEGADILERLFSLLGREYKSGVISSIDSSRAAFLEYSAKAREEEKKNVRLVCALLLGGVLGVVILLI